MTETGAEQQEQFYNRHNTTESLDIVVLALIGDTAVACGALKEHSPEVAEIKRIFVSDSHRKNGIGKRIISALEKAAADQGFRRLILETGTKMPEAQALYARLGYEIIENFGVYASLPDSVCMGKNLS